MLKGDGSRIEGPRNRGSERFVVKCSSAGNRNLQFQCRAVVRNAENGIVEIDRIDCSRNCGERLGERIAFRITDAKRRAMGTAGGPLLSYDDIAVATDGPKGGRAILIHIERPGLEISIKQ